MIRAIATLPAVIGAWGKQGSGLLLSTSAHFPLNKRAITRPDLQVKPDSQSATQWGRERPRAINMNEIGQALLEETDPPIRALYVYNSNPAGVAPDSNRVLAGLSRDDLFTVVHEQMMTDTARYADILLPATSQMECLDLMRAYGHLYLNLCQPAIPPLGESRANIDVLNALAKAMGYEENAFDQTAEQIIRAALDSSSPVLEGITYEYLQEHGFARLKTIKESVERLASSVETPAQEQQSILNAQRLTLNALSFRTASGKVELYSARAARDGYDPLPGYEPPAESREADPELAAEFPINLLTPAAHHFLNTSFANLSSLQKGEREPRIWVSPQDAAERSVTEGDWLRVWNRRGEVRLRAVVSDNVKPGVAWSPSLWWHRDSPDNRNVNALTSARLTDMGGGSTFHTNLIQFAAVCNSDT
jgi:anaerobic selenocysteine-containing dehydrogenase